jgi:hypothetical protein
MTSEQLSDQAMLVTRIQEALDRGDFRHTELSKESGISSPHLSNFLKGRRSLSADAERQVEVLLRRSEARRPDRERLLAKVRNHFATIDLRFLLPDEYCPDLASVDIREVYVEPKLVPVCRGNQDEPRTPSQVLAEMEPTKRPVLHLVAPAGAGKTSCMRALVATLQVKGGYDRFPVAYPLSNLNRKLAGRLGQPGFDLIDLITEWYEESTEFMIGPELRQQVEDGTALLLLDGLDEVSNSNGYRTEAVGLINRFTASNRGKGNIVVVSERGSPPFGRLDRIGFATAYTFASFGLPEAEELIGRWHSIFARGKGASAGLQGAEPLVRQLSQEHYLPLTQNRFLLTLATVMYFREGRLIGPGSAQILQRFFDTALGTWATRRSMDPMPSPQPNDDTLKYPHDVLMHIAWDVGARRRTVREELPAAAILEVVRARLMSQRGQVDSAMSFIERQRLEEDAQRFLDTMEAAGILVRATTAPRLHYKFGIHDQLALAWYQARIMIADQRKFERQFERSLDDPFYERWRLPLRYVLTLWTGMDNLDAVRDALERALGWRPGRRYLPLEEGFQGDELYRVMPLGLILSMGTLDDADLPKGLVEQIIDCFRGFYEGTDFAVVIAALQEWAAAHVDRFNQHLGGRLRIPTDPDDVAALLKDIEKHDEQAWRARVDETWRYQTQLRSFHRLLAAAEARYPRFSEGRRFLVRRLVFGMRFVRSEDSDECIRLLRDSIAMRYQDDSVIRDMAEHTRANLGRRELSRVQREIRNLQDGEPDPPSRKTIEGWGAAAFFDQVRPHTFTLIRSDEFAKTVMEAGEVIFGKRGLALVEFFTEVLVEPSRDQWDRATAAVLLGKYLKSREPREIRAHGQHWDVVKALARLASQREPNDQHTSVSAGHLYDFAAWALRCSFVRGSFEEDLSLPLRPGSPEA